MGLFRLLNVTVSTAGGQEIAAQQFALFLLKADHLLYLDYTSIKLPCSDNVNVGKCSSDYGRKSRLTYLIMLYVVVNVC